MPLGLPAGRSFSIFSYLVYFIVINTTSHDDLTEYKNLKGLADQYQQLRR